MNTIIFPKEQSIPPEYQLETYIENKEYLIDGDLYYWNGEMKEVLSPVCIENEAGEIVNKVIGSYPMLTPKEADLALNAAIRAYNQGKGRWAMMSVFERI
ncbi:MAG: NADP-dependent glyceraldehyde-3-phosphate dehydrogenase, partial [Bacteroidetes bacterium]